MTFFKEDEIIAREAGKRKNKQTLTVEYNCTYDELRRMFQEAGLDPKDRRITADTLRAIYKKHGVPASIWERYDQLSMKMSTTTTRRSA